MSGSPLPHIKLKSAILEHSSSSLRPDLQSYTGKNLTSDLQYDFREKNIKSCLCSKRVSKEEFLMGFPWKKSILSVFLMDFYGL